MLLAVGVSCETLFFGSLLLYSTDRLLDYGYEHLFHVKISIRPPLRDSLSLFCIILGKSMYLCVFDQLFVKH